MERSRLPGSPANKSASLLSSREELFRLIMEVLDYASTLASINATEMYEAMFHLFNVVS